MKQKYYEMDIDDHPTAVKWAQRCSYPFWPARVVMDIDKEKEWAASNNLDLGFAKKDRKKKTVLLYFFGLKKYIWLKKKNHRIIPFTAECPNPPTFKWPMFEDAVLEARKWNETEIKKKRRMEETKKRKRNLDNEDNYHHENETKNHNAAQNITTTTKSSLFHESLM